MESPDCEIRHQKQTQKEIIWRRFGSVSVSCKRMSLAYSILYSGSPAPMHLLLKRQDAGHMVFLGKCNTLYNIMYF